MQSIIQSINIFNMLCSLSHSTTFTFSPLCSFLEVFVDMLVLRKLRNIEANHIA